MKRHMCGNQCNGIPNNASQRELTAMCRKEVYHQKARAQKIDSHPLGEQKSHRTSDSHFQEYDGTAFTCLNDWRDEITRNTGQTDRAPIALSLQAERSRN